MNDFNEEQISILNARLSTYKYNKLDNSYNNKCIYKIHDEECLPGEEFRSYKYYLRSTSDFRKFALSKAMEEFDIEVSNLGRIKVNGEIAKQYQKKYGYLVVKISEKINYNVYRLVAETFVDCPDEDTFKYEGGNYWTVHHITNNGFDNRKENLIWLSRNNHRKIKDYASQTLRNIKNEIYHELVSALELKKEEEFILDKLEDFYLLKKNDDDDLLIDKICNKYNISLEEFKSDHYL